MKKLKTYLFIYPDNEEGADLIGVFYEVFLACADAAQTYDECEVYGFNDQIIWFILGSLFVDVPDAVLPITIDNGYALGVTIIVNSVGFIYLVVKLIFPYPI